VPDPTGFVLKVSELPRIIEVLSYQGVVPLAAVAKEVGRPEAEVRDLLVRYYVTEDAQDRLGMPPPIEFLDDLGEEALPSEATCVRLQHRYVVDDLAFDYAPVEYLARVYRVARDESLLEPDNAVLAGAVEKLRAYLDEDLTPSAATEGGGLSAAEWYRAARDHHRVRIRYVRTWWPGAAERVGVVVQQQGFVGLGLLGEPLVDYPETRRIRLDARRVAFEFRRGVPQFFPRRAQSGKPTLRIAAYPTRCPGAKETRRAA